MNLSCGYLLCCYLFCLLLFSSILSHLSTLCHLNSSEVYYRIWIRFPPCSGVLIYHFYLLLFRYHRIFSLHILKKESSYLSHCVNSCRPETIFSGWLYSTTLWSDYRHMDVGTCWNKLNRCNYFLSNMIDAFWIFLDGGYICMCICYHVGRAEGE